MFFFWSLEAFSSYNFINIFMVAIECWPVYSATATKILQLTKTRSNNKIAMITKIDQIFYLNSAKSAFKTNFVWWQKYSNN